MSANEIYSSIKKNISTMNPSLNASILPCRIDKVNRDTLTADVYLQDTSSIVYNVPLCFPSKGRNFGALFMPKEGSTYLMVYTSRGRPYVLTYASITNSHDITYQQTVSDKMMPGENSLQGVGGGLLRQDLVGNSFSLSSFGNATIQRMNGVNSSYANGRENRTIASKEISGFAINTNISTDTPILNNDDMKVVNYEEYYTSVGTPKVFRPSEFIDVVDGVVTMKEDIKSAVLDIAKVTIDKVNIFKSQMVDFQSQIQNTELTDDELNSLITNILTGISNDFNIPKKGVKIVIEKGNAINRELDNISDVLKLETYNFDKSENNLDICLRLKVIDIASNTVKASASIDTDGNCLVKFKKLTIEVETGGYELREV